MRTIALGRVGMNSLHRSSISRPVAGMDTIRMLLREVVGGSGVVEVQIQHGKLQLQLLSWVAVKRRWFASFLGAKLMSNV
jgi:hypothetical protein